MRPFYGIFLRMGGWVSVFLVWAGFIIAGIGITEQINAAKIAEAWETTSAVITKKTMSIGQGSSKDSFGGTTRYYVEYEFTLKGTVYSNSYPVYLGFYNSVSEGDVRPARYYAASPEVNELFEGQLARSSLGNTVVGSALSLLGLLIALGFGFSTRKALQVLRSGTRVQATVLDTYGLAMFGRIRFGFKAPNGAIITRKTFWRLKRAHRGLKRRDLIEVKYDPAQPAYAYWQSDLTGRK